MDGSTRPAYRRAARGVLARVGARLLRAGTDPSAAEATSDFDARFRSRCAELPSPRVLELGTLQSQPGRSTMHRDWVPHAAEFLGTDMVAGPDVDVVADLHRLTDAVGPERFDVILSMSTFEHLKYPHVAAHELMKALKVGGVLFVQTHQAFPLHAYPHDYFRFSREALAGLFGTRMGTQVVATEYDFPAQIHARRVADVRRHPSFLNVKLWAEKRTPTPDAYVFEL